MSGLGNLVGHLTAIADEAACWALPTDDVMRILDVRPARFWREMHAVRNKVDFARAIDGFCQDTVGDLVTFLERFVGPEAEDALVRAGLFLPHELRVDLMEAFLREGRRFAASQEIDAEELSSMLAFTGSVRKAIAIYFDAHTDLEALIAASAEAFRLERGLPEAGRATAARCLHSLFERHVLDRAAMLAGLADRLRRAAARVGYVDPEEPAEGRGRAGAQREGTGEAAGGQSTRVAWARTIMGFAEEPLSAEELRSRYRELVMRYHPDANPAGLERCKDVNAAYSILMSAGDAPG